MGCSGSKDKASVPVPANQTAPKTDVINDKAVDREDVAGAPAVADATTKDSQASESIQVDTNVQVGNKVTVCATGLTGEVLQRTTTDLQIQMEEGGDPTWVAIEDVRITDKVDIEIGATVRLRSEEAEVVVAAKTTTDLQLQMADGSTRWVGIEDVDKIADAAKEPVGIGARVVIRGELMHGTVQQKNETDVQVKLSNGCEKWYGIDEVEEIGKIEDEPEPSTADSLTGGNAGVEESMDREVFNENKWCCAGF